MGDWGELAQVLRVYWSLLLGNVVEWYEFTIYGYQAIYLEKNFFQGSDVGVWLGFSITFLARPLGGVFLGSIGDKFGRSVAVNISIIGMLIGTVGQGCLPTANCGIPWLANLGLVLLVFTRFLQGLSAGGEIATVTTYLTEVAPKNVLSRGVALVNVTAAAGFLAAKLIAYMMEATLGPAGVQAWGWRIPFILTIIPGGIAIMGRRYIPESAHFLEGKQQEGKQQTQEGACARVKSLFVNYWPNILVTIGVVSTHAVMTYGCGVWIQHYLAKAGMTPGDRMIVDAVARFMNFALAMPIGWLADIYGLGFIVLMSVGSIAVTSLPLWVLLSSDPTNVVVGILALGIGYSWFATCMGSLIYHFAVENFPVEVRNTGMGIAYNIGMSAFGGLAPVFVTLVLEATCGEAGMTGNMILTETKTRAMRAAVTEFYSRYPNQSWKNIVSIGDALFEHHAIRQVVEEHMRSNSNAKKCRTKTLKLLDGPTVSGLAIQLRIVFMWLKKMVEADDHVDIDFSADEASINAWRAAFSSEAEFGSESWEPAP